MKYTGTLLTTSDAPTKDEINKAILDLLAKINEQTETSANGAPVGTVFQFAGTDDKIPAGYLLCDGAAVNRQKYAALYNVIGETWGAGDGSRTFNLPDMRAATPAGVGTSTGFTVNETVAIGVKYDDQFQSHKHLLGITGAGALAGYSSLDFLNNRVIVNNTNNVQSPSVDGANGTPRVGTTTHGKLVGINFIIKY